MPGVVIRSITAAELGVKRSGWSVSLKRFANGSLASIFGLPRYAVGYFLVRHRPVYVICCPLILDHARARPVHASIARAQFASCLCCRRGSSNSHSQKCGPAGKQVRQGGAGDSGGARQSAAGRAGPGAAGAGREVKRPGNMNT
eukprot:14838858-Heterocapsa_arctica.AAC.1